MVMLVQQIRSCSARNKITPWWRVGRCSCMLRYGSVNRLWGSSREKRCRRVPAVEIEVAIFCQDISE